MATPEKVFEVNKSMELSSMMQLVDLNGTMVNFQSDFTIASDDTNILVAIVNQNQLDSGDFQFEQVNGSYSRRITYQENEHQNHYIALKCGPTQTAKCQVTIRLRELQPIVRKRETVDERHVRFEDPDMNMPIQGKSQVMNKGMEQDMSYQGMNQSIEQGMSKIHGHSNKHSMEQGKNHGIEHGRSQHERREVLPSNLSPSLKQEIQDELENLHCQEDYEVSPDTQTENMDIEKKKKEKKNPYYLFGIVCLILCAIILSYKFLGKSKK
uniref:Uncharacterized protein n=1 Tax=viral metagenome TaxID=1070528 RepID=A0A6C0KF28_9ZZZZ